MKEKTANTTGRVAGHGQGVGGAQTTCGRGLRLQVGDRPPSFWAKPLHKPAPRPHPTSHMTHSPPQREAQSLPLGVPRLMGKALSLYSGVPSQKGEAP